MELLGGSQTGRGEKSISNLPDVRSTLTLWTAGPSKCFCLNRDHLFVFINIQNWLYDVCNLFSSTEQQEACLNNETRNKRILFAFDL